MAQERRQEGPGRWFLKGTQFSAWRQEPASFLWLNGIPGCGKTVLSSAIIDYLQQIPNDTRKSHILLYFYFDFTDVRKQSPENAILSLISQLYYKRPQSQKHLDLLWSMCMDGRQLPGLQQLSSIFEKMLQDAGEISILLDALDECQRGDRIEFLSWLQNLRLQQKNMRLLVTSRPEDDIEAAIKKLAMKDEILRLESHLIADDIHNFIQKQVTSSKDFRRWQNLPEIQWEIKHTLQKKSNGMYDYDSNLIYAQ